MTRTNSSQILLRTLTLLALLGLCSCSVTARSDTSVAAAAAETSITATPASSSPSAVEEDSPRPFDLTRPEIASFITEMASKHRIDEAEIRQLLAAGQYQPRIIAAISRPAETVLTWWQYRARLVNNERIERGAEFFRTHRQRLEAVQARTGVEAAYLVAILGIETNYGRTQGSWRVLDALMTLGFDYPPRSRFFRSELEQFVLLAREEALDPLNTRGSYAGAMGAPQFMPSSYRRYAVDGSSATDAVVDAARKNQRDLFTDWDDVLASIANYFLEHGWQAGQPVLIEATAPAGTMATLDRRTLDLNTTIGELRQRGVQPARTLPDATPALLVPAELENAENLRIGLRNFYVITRYNRSTLYAMAIHDLASAIDAKLRAAP
jgi:membrane-bound lytic murein transglycosylase B